MRTFSEYRLYLPHLLLDHPLMGRLEALHLLALLEDV